MNAIELEQDLKYICPCCDHEFYSAPWGTFNCPKCRIELDTSFLIDNYVNVLAICTAYVSETFTPFTVTVTEN
jgi:ribosomal protein L37AE/L43A